MMRPAVATLAASLLLTSCAAKMTPGSPARPDARTTSARVIPAPATAESHTGPGFVLTADTAVVVATGDEHVRWIGDYLSRAIGTAVSPTPPRVVTADAPPPASVIRLELGADASSSDEGYEVVVAERQVSIRAPRPAGLFYGVQTFRQLLPAFIEYAAVRPDKSRPVTAPAVRIADAPRFAWRGAMLDVSRHFLPVDAVKRYIDVIALYKLNRLHLHLADDQGWRIEITSWPNLATHGGSTEVGGGPGGFYTQAQYADLVQYAARRFVTIVPEIDMPGHTNAALASYAELNCDGAARELYTGIEVGFSALCVDKDVTYRFIDDVVREIAAMTPGPWFHIGGDEVKTLTEAQYVAFIERVQGIVESHGKQTIGWDEIAPARLLPTTLVQHWRPKTSPADAVAKGARVIMSVANRTYLDMKYDGDTVLGLAWAGPIAVRTAYDWDPVTVAPGLTEAALAGVEAPLWSETVGTIQDFEFLAFPRLVAIAEVAWSQQDKRDWESFRARLGAHGPRLGAMGVNFYRSPEIEWER